MTRVAGSSEASWHPVIRGDRPGNPHCPDDTVTDNVQQRGPMKLLDPLFGRLAFAQQVRMGKPPPDLAGFHFGVFEPLEPVRSKRAGESPPAPPGLTAMMIGLRLPDLVGFQGRRGRGPRRHSWSRRARSRNGHGYPGKCAERNKIEHPVGRDAQAAGTLPLAPMWQSPGSAWPKVSSWRPARSARPNPHFGFPAAQGDAPVVGRAEQILHGPVDRPRRTQIRPPQSAVG